MDDKLIDLIELWGLFKRRWLTIIAITFVTTAFGIYEVSGYQESYIGRMTVLLSKGENDLEYYTETEMKYY